MRRLGPLVELGAPMLLIVAAGVVATVVSRSTQIYVLQRAGGITRDTNLLGVYAYRTSFGNRFDKGAAIAIVMVLITMLMTLFYLRSMTRTEEL